MKADRSQRKDILSGVELLTHPEKMGERFKFLALLQKRDSLDPGYIPAGFKSLSWCSMRVVWLPSNVMSVYVYQIKYDWKILYGI